MIFGGMKKAVVLFITATALSACGSLLEELDEEKTPVDFSLSSLETEESSCGEAFGVNREAIDEALSRYNEASDSERRYRASHPVSPDGVSVKVCDDAKVLAYAYTRTVIIHEGLLDLLKEAAYISSEYGNDTKKRDRKLDALAISGSDGEFLIEEPAGDYYNSYHLFSSAVAFVIFHELGHTELGHTTLLSNEKEGGFTDRRHAPTLELEADVFASYAMRSAGYTDSGATLLFWLLDRINPDGSATHPTSKERAGTFNKLSPDRG